VLTTDDLLTVPEAARLLGKTPETVHRWIASGAVPVVRTPAGRKMIRRTDLDFLLDIGSPLNADLLSEAQLDLVRRTLDHALSRLLRQAN
jgi:excisionase family DNA binding protein